jgi:hypothetical protein
MWNSSAGRVRAVLLEFLQLAIFVSVTSTNTTPRRWSNSKDGRELNPSNNPEIGSKMMALHYEIHLLLSYHSKYLALGSQLRISVAFRIEVSFEIVVTMASFQFIGIVS